jgi:cytochrome oxidase assembly protein ShyY1
MDPTQIYRGSEFTEKKALFEEHLYYDITFIILSIVSLYFDFYYQDKERKSILFFTR